MGELETMRCKRAVHGVEAPLLHLCTFPQCALFSPPAKVVLQPCWPVVPCSCSWRAVFSPQPKPTARRAPTTTVLVGRELERLAQGGNGDLQGRQSRLCARSEHPCSFGLFGHPLAPSPSVEEPLGLSAAQNLGSMVPKKISQKGGAARAVRGYSTCSSSSPLRFCRCLL